MCGWFQDKPASGHASDEPLDESTGESYAVVAEEPDDGGDVLSWRLGCVAFPVELHSTCLLFPSTALPTPRCHFMRPSGQLLTVKKRGFLVRMDFWRGTALNALCLCVIRWLSVG